MEVLDKVMPAEQRFKELLAFAWKHSSFYRRIYTKHGIRERDLHHVTLQDLPVVTKSDVMEHFDEAVTDPRLRVGQLKNWLQQDSNPQSLYLDEYVVVHSSRGSTISSIVPFTRKIWRLITTTAAPDIFPEDPYNHAPLRSAFYFGPATRFVSSTVAALASHAAHQVVWFSICDPLEEVWANLNTLKPEYLSSYGSCVAWLAAWTLEGKLQIRPSSVLVSGDRLTPYARSMIQQAWEAKIYDLYAASESLFMALQKPGDSGFKVFTDLNVLEVVDASHRMVQSGEKGRVVMTNLINLTLPLIRFDLDDEAILGKVGFGAETLERIDGKTSLRLPVRLANGDIAALPLHTLHSLEIAGCDKLQFISHSPDEVEIQYEARQNLDVRIETAFRTLLAANFAKVQTIRLRSVALMHNDAETAKFLEVTTPDRPSYSFVRLSDQAGAAQRSPELHETARVPLSISESADSLFERFQRMVSLYPTHVAVTDGEQQLTYEECSRAAHKIARGLLQRGFDSGRPVAVLSGHRVEMILPLFGILGAGGFYLALDSHLPLERMQTILDETRPEYILTIAEQEQVARALGVPYSTVIRVEDLLAAEPVESPYPEVSLDNPACLLYTSGSTGTPKGIVFSHKTVLHRMRRYMQDFGLSSTDRLSLLQSFAVSAGVRDIFGALLNGATLAIYDIRSRGIQALPAWMNQLRLSIFYAVPTIWRLLLEVLSDETFPWLRIVRLGGEAVQPRDLDGFKIKFPEGCRLVNGYASTETDTICQYFMDHKTDIIANRIPVGMPVQGISVTILDDFGRAVIGAIGVIAVEGETLAYGYWNPNDRQIVPLQKYPFPVGDLGYRLSDGRIFLTGRRDFIVKVHGYRIHLSEIERALSSFAEVREAVAVSRATPAGDTVITTYYVPVSDHALPQEKLRQTLASALPSPAVPISFIPLRVLPRLPGGKINYNLLRYPALFNLSPTAEEMIYENQIEATLAEIWKEILGLKIIPPEADFLDLGGDSITALRVLNRIRAGFNVTISVPEFFNNSTLPRMAQVIARLQWKV